MIRRCLHLRWLRHINPHPQIPRFFFSFLFFFFAFCISVLVFLYCPFWYAPAMLFTLHRQEQWRIGAGRHFTTPLVEAFCLRVDARCNCNLSIVIAWAWEEQKAQTLYSVSSTVGCLRRSSFTVFFFVISFLFPQLCGSPLHSAAPAFHTSHITHISHILAPSMNRIIKEQGGAKRMEGDASGSQPTKCEYVFLKCI